MSQSVQYVTNQQGERVGVLLDLETYHKLTNTNTLTVDVEILTSLSLNELQALAETTLALRDQAQLDNLLARMTENQLSPDETAILDRLLAHVDQLNILKTRARYTLNILEATPRLA